MKCSNCGKKINKTFKLCPHCGETVEYIKKEKSLKLNKKFLILICFILIALVTITSIIIFNNKVDFEELKKSVVLINVYDSDNELISTGSGVVAFENDIILTNAHVVEDNYKIEVISENNTKYQVEGILDYNKKKDIAILKLVSSKGLKKVKIEKKIKIGSNVTAIGSPLGLKNTISTGIISAMYQDNIEVYQHTAPISHGSSGGALFDDEGNLVGITYASLTAGQNLNLAIPIKYFLEDYKKVEKNDIIDTQYYSWLNNTIIKTKNGSKLLSYVLNDRFENYKFKSGLYNENIYEKGTLDRCLSLSNCIYGGFNTYDKIKKNIVSSVFLRSGYGDMVCGLNTSLEDCQSIEGSNYAIAILKLNTTNSQTIEKSKNIILDMSVLENSKIYVKNKYVYAIDCNNYDDCDTVKRLVENIVNQ